MTKEFNPRHGGWQAGGTHLVLILVWFYENTFVMPVFKEMLAGKGIAAPDGVATILRIAGLFGFSQFAATAIAIAIACAEATAFSALYRRFGQWAAWAPFFVVTILIAGALFANAVAMALVVVCFIAKP